MCNQMVHVIPTKYAIQAGVRVSIPAPVPGPVVWIGVVQNDVLLANTYQIQHIVEMISAETGVELDWGSDRIYSEVWIVAPPTTSHGGLADVMDRCYLAFGPHFTHYRSLMEKI